MTITKKRFKKTFKKIANIMHQLIYLLFAEYWRTQDTARSTVQRVLFEQGLKLFQ